MKFTVPAPDEGAPSSGDEIAWRRELKQLRVRVTQLEAEKGNRQTPSIGVTRGEHGIRCGSPCHVWVYTDEPRVECQACKSRLDAIDVLRDYANHERNFCYSLEHLRKERADLSAEIAKLKKLRLKLRSDVKKAMPEVPTAAGDRKWDRDQVANMLLDRELSRMPEG